MWVADVLTSEMCVVEAERASLIKEGAFYLLKNHTDSFNDFANGKQKVLKPSSVVQ